MLFSSYGTLIHHPSPGFPTTQLNHPNVRLPAFPRQVSPVLPPQTSLLETIETTGAPWHETWGSLWEAISELEFLMSSLKGPCISLPKFLRQQMIRLEGRVCEQNGNSFHVQIRASDVELISESLPGDGKSLDGLISMGRMRRPEWEQRISAFWVPLSL